MKKATGFAYRRLLIDILNNRLALAHNVRKEYCIVGMRIRMWHYYPVTDGKVAERARKNSTFYLIGREILTCIIDGEVGIVFGDAPCEFLSARLCRRAVVGAEIEYTSIIGLELHGIIHDARDIKGSIELGAVSVGKRIFKRDPFGGDTPGARAQIIFYRCLLIGFIAGGKYDHERSKRK